MRKTTLLKVAGQSILKNKMRTLLTMLGIIIGVGAVIVMVAVGQGAQGQIQAQINGLGSNLIVVTPGSSSRGGVSQGAGTFNRLSLDDVEKLRREGVVITRVSPVLATRSQVIGGEGNWRASINGVSTDFQQIRDWSTRQGAFFTEADVRANRKAALLGATVADNLFPGTDPVGQRVQIRDVPFEVVGVLAPKGQSSSGTDQDDVVLVPYTTMHTRLAGRQFIPQILASTEAASDIPAAQEEIRVLLRESHRLGQGEDDDFQVQNQTDLVAAASGTTRVMSMLLAAIASVSLLVGGIGIMNIMLVSVTERTREIGIRMAIGARGRDVLTQFLVESVVVSTAGGILGVGVGLAGAALLGRLTGWTVALSPGTVLLALGFSGGVGIFFGFYPARKAAALHPIDALRYE